MFTASHPVSRSRRTSPLSRSRLMLALTAAVGLPLALSLTGCDGSSKVASTPTNGTTTGGSTTSGTPAAGKATISLTFSSPANTNANTSAFASTQGQGGLNVNAVGLNNLSAGGSTQSGGPLRVVLISLLTNGAAEVGKSYPIGTASNGGATNVSLTQTTISTTAAAMPSTWISTGGSIIVDSISGKTYKMRLVDVTMGTGEGNDSASTGTFTLNGTATLTTQ